MLEADLHFRGQSKVRQSKKSLVLKTVLTSLTRQQKRLALVQWMQKLAVTTLVCQQQRLGMLQ